MYDILNVYLENGLRIVMHKKTNTIGYGLWVKQGNKHENEINNGLSHFIAHYFNIIAICRKTY